MFTAARYVIVDDDEKELAMLTSALQKMGAPCLPLHYDQAEGLDSSHLRGVRLLFLDLHLTTGAQTTNVSLAASIIVGMLEEGITATSGPYVIILWTKQATQKEGFEAYVMEHLDSEKRPIAILSLDKNPYLTAGSGDQLLADVARVVETDPRLKALFNWEREVLRAAGSTLSEVASLVTEPDRRAPMFSEKLDEVLSLLAYEAVGRANAQADPFSAINAVLLPIMSDRIANQRTNPDTDQIWQAAVTRVANVAAPDLATSARLNTMLHVAVPTAEAMTATSWGAVTIIPEDRLEDLLTDRFDVDCRSLLASVFCVQQRADRRASRLAMIRVGANCDYAQSRRGPIPFVLGAIVPAGAGRRRPSPKAEIATPPIRLEGFDGPVLIVFNTHLQISMVPSEAADWAPVCRLREQLLMQVTTHGAMNSTRPAIVRFAPAEDRAA